MEAFQSFKISYLAPTDTVGARVWIKDERFGQSIRMPLDYQFNSIVEQAIEYLQNKGYEIAGYTEDRVLSTGSNGAFKPLKGKER